jgi:hypothetical protein
MLDQKYELKHLGDKPASEIRHFMLEELLWSLQHEKLYFSQYLTDRGGGEYPQLLYKALASGTPDSLEESLSAQGIFREDAPKKSIQTFAWDEFNKYYMRALCRWVIEHAGYALVVIRGRHSESTRSSSNTLLGQTKEASSFLNGLRQSPRINPFGANSGLTLMVRESIEGV